MDQKGMVELIRARGVRDPLVLEAMARVPRHRFVPESQRAWAYDDHAMSIGCQQTISQPYIVALMTEALDLQPGNRVLEVGTGSGYQTAVLADMGMDVYTIERIPELYTQAKALLEELGYAAHCRLGDGYYGWPEFAPYDGIIVTAAPEETPPALLEQLADGGRLVIPTGPRHGYQTLWKIIKHGDKITKLDLGGVAFVPFITP
ncbi:MAG TPA: protein-L-isoaspartate(D-aspartate) O-methyltransferase [Anaerolineae bacterium]|nr:protein-L-isoaspartate(D-aspartate) O-methyltransferase [Anaerolineae bacterium]HQK15447.1 protein-L-isoaspartate(D-aspartate) O-methyltransferase [Anaerolineae bacterium]